MKTAMLYAGATLAMFWGIAHIMIPTKQIVARFGRISAENSRILVMEWLMEGILLIFLGTLVICITALGPQGDPMATIVYRLCAAVLVVMAAVSLFTGARTTILPMKLCPYLFLVAAALLFMPTVM